VTGTGLIPAHNKQRDEGHYMNILGVGIETTLVTILIMFCIYQQSLVHMIARENLDLAD
jgi:hypothetical protein